MTAQNFVARVDGLPVAANFVFTEGNRTVTLEHPAAFGWSKTVEVLVKDITDLKGNASAEICWSFVTAAEPDTTAPVLLSYSPQGSNVARDAVVTATFNEAVTGVSSQTVSVIANGNPVAGTACLAEDGRTVSFRFTETPAYGTVYSVQLAGGADGIRDLAGNSFAGCDWSFTTLYDTAAPVVVETVPANGAVAVAPNSAITIRYDEPLDSSVVPSMTVRCGSASGTPVDGTVSVQGATVSFTPSHLLTDNEYNTFHVSVSGACDMYGNVAGATQWSFSTSGELDTVAAQVVLSVPDNGQIGTADSPLHASKIYVKFSEKVNSATVNTATVKLYNGSAQETVSVRMIAGDTLECEPQQNLERETVYRVEIAGGSAGVKDMAGNSLAANYSFSFTTLEKLRLLRHFYRAGSYDKNYTGFDTAYTDNMADSNVQIHSYIVLEFNLPVDAATVAGRLLVKRNALGTAEIADSAENNYNVIGRIANDFPNNVNLRGQYIGELKADPADNTRLVFEHHMVFYVAANGSYDIEHPNWNGIKPGYRYDVTVQDGVRDIWGSDLAAHNVSNNKRQWSFTTTDLDYGLYWFKDGYHALKYVPGRVMPVEYYDPAKPLFIHSHGWQNGTTGVSRGGTFRDYRREDYLWGGTTEGRWDVNTPVKDIAAPWKHGSDITRFPQGGGKDWNVGAYFWTQFADNQDEGGAQGSAKPRRAGTAIWSIYGPSSQADGRVEYATNVLIDGKYEAVRVSTNAPNKAVSTILTDALQSCCSNRPAGFDPEFRLTGHSLGNQMVHAILYTLKTRHAAGTLPGHLMPDRFFIVDPYWVDGDFWLDDRGNDWDKPNAPESTGYWWRPECPVRPLVQAGKINGNVLPGAVCTEIIKDVIAYYQNRSAAGQAIKGLPVLPCAMYDTSGLPDGKTSQWVTFYNGDWNEPYREEVAMIYHYYEWMSFPNDATKLYGWGEQHGNGRYQAFWLYGCAVPAGGFSPRSDSAVIIAAMNCFKADAQKGRFEYANGCGTSSVNDDTYFWTTAIDPGVNKWPATDTPAGRTGAWMINAPRK